MCKACDMFGIDLEQCVDLHPLTEDMKLSNPKDMIGSDKLPMSQVPGSFKAYVALAFLEGMLKYGQVNWREAGVRTSIYMDALERHYEKFKNGEWADPVTHVPHLASMGACEAIIMDAKLCGKLIDDRPKSAPVAELIDELSETVKHLKELHKDKSPYHYTIKDNDDADVSGYAGFTEIGEINGCPTIVEKVGGTDSSAGRYSSVFTRTTVSSGSGAYDTNTVPVYDPGLIRGGASSGDLRRDQLFAGSKDVYSVG